MPDLIFDSMLAPVARDGATVAAHQLRGQLTLTRLGTR